jgi:vitamin B12 transporter
LGGWKEKEGGQVFRKTKETRKRTIAVSTERVFPGHFFRLLFFLILIFPARTFGQEGSGPPAQLTPVEITSTRIPGPVDEATDSVTIINTGEIRANSAPLAIDQIRGVPGVSINASGSVGEDAAIWIRGSEQYQSLVLFDGVRLNSPYTRAADLGDYFIAGLDRIEILKGAFSSLYGSDAIGGVINLVPYPGRSLFQGVRKEKGVSAWAEGGSMKTFKERAELFSAGEKYAFSLGYSRADSGGRNARDGFAGNLAAGKLQVLIPGGIEAGVSGLFSQSNKELYLDTPLSIYLQNGVLTQVKDSNYSWGRETALAAVSLRKKLVWNGEILVQGSVLRGEDDLLNPSDPGWADYHKSWTDTLKKGAGLQVHLTPVGMNSVLFGAEYFEEEAQQEMETNLPQGGQGDPERLKIEGGRIERALFLEDRFKLMGFFLNAGVRMDFNSDSPDSGPFISPRGSAAFKLDRFGTKIRAGFGRGYRAPSIDERFFPIQGNPELKPEEAWSYDAGAEQEFKKYGIKFDLTGFWIRYVNLIGMVPDSFQFQNSDRAGSDGLEAGLAYQPDPRIRIKLGYTFNRARKRTIELDESSQEPVKKWSDFFWRPQNSLVGSLDVVPVKNLALGFFWEWRDGYDEPYDILAPDGKLLTGGNPGFVRVNLFSEYTIPSSLKPVEGLSVFFRGENIFNRKYSELKGYPMPGISFYGGVNLKM